MILVNLGLFVILLLVLALPFLVKRIEEELEIFLFIMGCLAVTITSQWGMHLVHEALVEPLKITAAVFLAGFLFKTLQRFIAGRIYRVSNAIGLKPFIFLTVVLLGLLSSAITAIIASLLLVEIISCLKLDRKTEINIVICACYSIGLGAALTPIGEPLSTIAIAKLKGEPYHADFFYLVRLLWHYILPAILAFGLIGALITPRQNKGTSGLEATKAENIRGILIRTAKVYLFVMALIFLGSGFKPIIDTYISKIPYQGLYWINMISAILDNATLTAAEIGPSMVTIQIKSALLGLLIAGGMLIPGNIPNIISAGKLKIKSTEWAIFALPLGLVVMVAVYSLLLFLKV